MDLKTKGKVLLVAWVVNLILFVMCYVWFDYAVLTSAWYETSLRTMCVTLTVTKVILSFGLILVLVDLKKE